MDTILILIRQILQMFLLSSLGYLLFKCRKITKEDSKVLGNILLYLVLPILIVNSFQMERTREHVLGILYSAAGAVVLMLLSIFISRLFFKKDPIAAFASTFSNSGFFGIPLVIASLGEQALFYLACFVAFTNIGQWTYGISLLNGQPIRQGFEIKKLATAPFIVAVTVGMLLFFLGIQLPPFITSCMNAVTALNTPLGMFTIGIYLAQTDLLQMLKRPTLYVLSLVRLVLIPLLSLLLLSLLPEALHDMKVVLLIAAACPVGANIAVYAQLHNKDYSYAVETVVLSSLFSLLTIPAIVWLASQIW